MTSQVELLCGPDPDDPSTLFTLDLAYDESGQAYVFRGSGPGGTARPVTVRVWRPRNGRDLEKQRASWRKGAALLRGLRAVGGICRPIADFDGYAPWAPGSEPSGAKVPIQVLEWVEGENLKDRLATGGLDGPRILHALARTLVDLHRRGPIVHQDIAPSNVVVTPAGDVVLIDFTSARSDGDLTHFAGKLEQAAPEVVERLIEQPGNWRYAEPGAASDVFGFGGIAYLMVTGSTWRTGLVETLDDVVLPDALRTHLLLVLTDEASMRMSAEGLAPWVDELTRLVVETNHETPGVRWESGSVVTRTDPVWGDLPVPQDPFHTSEVTRFEAPRFEVTEPAPEPGFVTVTELRTLVTATVAVPRPRPAPPGTGEVVLVPGFVPGIAPRRGAIPEGRIVGSARTGPGPVAPTMVADLDPDPGAPVTLVAAPQELDDADRVRFADRFVLGSDYVIVLALATVVAWLVWLVGSGSVTNPDALGGIVIVALFAAAGEMLGQGVAALALSSRSRRGIGFWRGIHAGAAAVLVAAILFYGWLLATG